MRYNQDLIILARHSELSHKNPRFSEWCNTKGRHNSVSWRNILKVLPEHCQLIPNSYNSFSDVTIFHLSYCTFQESFSKNFTDTFLIFEVVLSPLPSWFLISATDQQRTIAKKKMKLLYSEAYIRKTNVEDYKLSLALHFYATTIFFRLRVSSLS